jgi:hypothetical protein
LKQIRAVRREAFLGVEEWLELSAHEVLERDPLRAWDFPRDDHAFRRCRTGRSAVMGSYQLRVSKTGDGGSSDINQSGEFSAGPGGPSTLSTVTLGGDGGSYVARLTVTWDGGTIECTERVRSAL